MRKFKILVAVLLLLAGGFTVFLMSRENSEDGLRKLKLAGTDLTVPARYLKVNRFFWVELAGGLDSGKGSIRVAVPYREIGCQFSGDPTGDVDVVINLLAPREYKQASVQMRSVVKEVEESNIPAVKFDGSTARYARNLEWAFYGQHNSGGQVVGRCSTTQDGVSRCSVVSSVSPDLVLEFSIDDRDEHCVDKIIYTTAGLISQWEMASKSQR